KPAQRPGAVEAFHGFINLFDDYLAPELMAEMNKPVDLIWGAADPWEPLHEARRWAALLPCISSLEVVDNAGHCPHDEVPEKVNPLLLRIIQQAT
ncbi:MAG TPA: alpha/beta hydrolase, partial [Prochlorococcaceae cyanobacterium Fu_MAG_134]|nr:alpha/beta hydrolase [Prochlorococcaceae cyanobacterium Fu_MAG_134]